MSRLNLVVEKLREQGYRPFSPDRATGAALRMMPAQDQPSHRRSDDIIGSFAVGAIVGFALGVLFAVQG